MPVSPCAHSRHHARDERQIFLIKQVRHALDRDRFDRRIGEDDLLEAVRRRIAFVGGVDIRPEHLAQARQLREKEGQDFLRVRSFAAFAAAVDRGKALHDFGLQPRVQRLDAAHRDLRQLAGVHDRLAVEAREENAEQFHAGGVDRGTRRQCRGGFDVVDPAVLGDMCAAGRRRRP